MLLQVLIKNCNSCVYLICILSNKLDLNQETHFTIVCQHKIYSSDDSIRLKLHRIKLNNWTHNSKMKLPGCKITTHLAIILR